MWLPICVKLNNATDDTKTTETADNEWQASKKNPPVMRIARYASSSNQQQERNAKNQNHAKQPQWV